MQFKFSLILVTEQDQSLLQDPINKANPQQHQHFTNQTRSSIRTFSDILILSFGKKESSKNGTKC